MTRKISIFIITCLLSCGFMLPVSAQFSREYTQDNPLIIVSDWEFPPYEFRNDKGEPDGYNVEVLNLVLNKLNIPHQFVMQEWYQATKTFEDHEADLIHALSGFYRKNPYVMTQNMITYYPVKSVRRKGQEPLLKISQLTADDTLMMKKNDYAALNLLQMDPQFNIEYHSPKEALTSIRNGKDSYYIWGELPLKMKLKEFGLDSLLVLDDIDIPAGELRIIGYDQELINAIDDTFARLEQSGDLQVLHDKWYHPDRIHNDSSPIALFVLAGSIIAIIVAFLLSRLIRNRIQAASVRSSDINGMMSQALKMGNLYVTEYDIENDHFRNVYGSMLPEEGISGNEIFDRLPQEIREESRRRTNSLITGGSDSWSFTRRFNLGTIEKPEWHFLQGNAVPERERGKTRFLVYSMKDITHEIEEERINSETGNKYMKMFETNLIAMSFYDKDGTLIDLNENMKRLCEFDAEGERYFRQLNLFDVPLFKEQFDPRSNEVLHICQKMHYADINIKKYIELRIRPTLDTHNELRFYVVTARDVSAERQMYLEQRKHENDIQRTNEAISRYESQLNYLLENSNMFIWNYDISKDRIFYTRTSLQKEYNETLEEFFFGIADEKKRKKALDEIQQCVAKERPYNAIHLYNYTPIEHKPVWYSISGIPKYDKDRHLIGYFGIARNITKLMDTQKQLKEETARAEDSGKMKSAFLANMTHEIRTPLNAIVGFSDLLPVVDTKEERLEFIRIIRNNCDMLMRLINDILEASSMGQALAIETKEVDFSTVFDDMCQTLAQRVEQPDVEFIKDNPYKNYVTTLDIGRVQQVLTNFVTNAVKYTHQGHIKVGYRYERRMTKDEKGESDGLYFYCEDTGVGIPEEKQASVFERFVKLDDFVQGTGLGLSICQAIADRCNGHIGVTSEGEGKGSTFWLWIPCEKNN
jgi:signal transduction histidine kinase/ABC-type amino acid transport substrate-binding protein